MKRIYKYPTGAKVPENSRYLATIKNGVMNADDDYYYVWHYYEVEVGE